MTASMSPSSQVSASPARIVDEYEKMIQKLEADVRQHIRIEQQLKVHIEAMHAKYEEQLQISLTAERL